jgi:hypothetical protein
LIRYQRFARTSFADGQLRKVSLMLADIPLACLERQRQQIGVEALPAGNVKSAVLPVIRAAEHQRSVTTLIVGFV